MDKAYFGRSIPTLRSLSPNENEGRIPAFVHESNRDLDCISHVIVALVYWLDSRSERSNWVHNISRQRGVRSPEG